MDRVGTVVVELLDLSPDKGIRGLQTHIQTNTHTDKQTCNMLDPKWKILNMRRAVKTGRIKVIAGLFYLNLE